MEAKVTFIEGSIIIAGIIDNALEDKGVTKELIKVRIKNSARILKMVFQHHFATKEIKCG